VKKLSERPDARFADVDGWWEIRRFFVGIAEIGHKID
jgi:hypothetical protein